jgi:hypothetical protein
MGTEAPRLHPGDLVQTSELPAMPKLPQHGLSVRLAMAIVLAAGCAGVTGCQSDIGGQTLPSPYYLYDDIQYFPSGPEFQLSQEAAAMKAAKANQTLQGR